jgi:type II protein arginine methyltransferase
MVAPSPVVDAMESPPFADHISVLSQQTHQGEMGVVKIGQTALHNPGGRSSWIGL